MNSDILIYQNSDGNIKIDVRLEEETVWLTQDQMATLFGKGRSTVAEHIANVFGESELEQIRICRKFRQVRMEGRREVEREMDHYNLDIIISVGYRVKSFLLTLNPFFYWPPKRGTQLIQATTLLAFLPLGCTSTFLGQPC